MGLKGSFATMALPDLLQWLSGAGQSGVLSVSDGRYRKQVVFKDGRVVSCSSDDPREYLGQFLLSTNTISEDQLRQAMETQRSTGVMLGKILLMVNAITEVQLRQALTRKAEEALFGLFLWKDGSFEFEESEPDLEAILPLSIKVENILLEGLRRYDELQVILQAFSSKDFVLARTDAPVPEELATRPDVRHLLDVVDGQRSLTEICLELRQSEFKVSRVAYALYKRGCLTVVEEASDTDGDQRTLVGDDLHDEVQRLVEAQKHEEAMELLRAAVETRGHDLNLQARLDEVEAAFVERAYRHFLPPDQILDLQVPLTELTDQDLTPQEIFLLSRINGAWSVNDIVTISPLREVDALRVLKTLRERGVVGFVDVSPPRPTP